MQRFAGKSAIVTGAGSGMGAATAHRLAADGAAVAVVDWRGDDARKVAEAIGAAGGRAIAIVADVSDPAAVEAAVQQTAQIFGGLHLAVNNAGISGGPALAAEITLENWNEVIGVNLSGVFYGLKYQIPAILSSGGGAIVNIASIYASIALPNFAAYTASKHGIVGLTRAAAIDYAKQPIRINTMCPGVIDTPLLASGGATSEALSKVIPNGRAGRPEEAAALTCFLLSDEASYINASEFAVDAGFFH